MRRKAVQQPGASEETNPKRNKTRRRVLKTVRSLLKILSKRHDTSQVKPRRRGRPPKVKPVAENAAEEEGISYKQIETWFKRKWSDGKTEVPDIQTAIDEEVASGRLVILPNKKYVLKNWKGGIKNVKSSKISSAAASVEAAAAVAGCSDNGSGGGGVVGRPKMKDASSFIHSESLPLFTREDNSVMEFPVDEESSLSSFARENKRKALASPSHQSLVKKFKVENGDDVRLVTSGDGSLVVIKNEKTLCGTCELSADCNLLGMPEPLLTCKECRISFHPSCLSYSKELAARASKFQWECASCKTCVVCGDTEEEHMLICDSCDRGYHMKCHVPPVSDKNSSSDEWLCSSCNGHSVKEVTVRNPTEVQHLSDAEKILTTANGGAVQNDCGSSSECRSNKSVGSLQPSTSEAGNNGAANPILLPTPNSSPSRIGETEEEANKNLFPPNESSIDYPLLPKLVLSVPGDPPNATNWTVEDVHTYFIRAGFAQHAETFKNEEIDGKALLLLTRPDVLSGMKFKLGPALKIYAHIHRIQESSSSV